jgi:hypothetical protein
MKTKRNLVLIIMVVLSLIFSGCAAQEAFEEVTSDMVPKEPSLNGGYATEAPEMEQSAADEERGFETGSGGTASAVERMVIYNANLEIAVMHPEEVMKEIMDMAESAGGFVVRSNLYQTYTESGSLPRASITIRVPAGELDSIMDAIKAMTPDPTEDVISENVSGQDVTAEYTDLQSRLRNLEAAEEALVQLMEDARDPEDVLNIFDELTYYRGEIEIVKGRIQYLEESADLSAISIEIIPKESLQPITIAGWEPKGTVKRAVEALISTAQDIVDILIWFGIYCLPFLIPLGIGVYFLVRFIIKRRKTKKAGKVEIVETTEESAQ